MLILEVLRLLVSGNYCELKYGLKHHMFTGQWVVVVNSGQTILFWLLLDTRHLPISVLRFIFIQTHRFILTYCIFEERYVNVIMHYYFSPQHPCILCAPLSSTRYISAGDLRYLIKVSCGGGEPGAMRSTVKSFEN